MSTNKILKLAGLNIGIAVLNIALFSPGLLNIRMKGSDALSIAIGGTAIFMSFIVFVYGNYKLISKKEKTIQISDIRSQEDCILALQQAYNKKTFDNDISIILEQIERFRKKKDKIMEVLLEKFSVIDMGYERFNSTIFDVEYVFFANIKSILNKINVFDEEEYKRITSSDYAEKRFSTKFIASKLSIYNEYISFVKNAIEDNEQILFKLDSLLLEISNFNSLDVGQIDNMNEIKELDKLIKKSKFYK